MTRISVVIPAYNDAAMLANALNALAAQIRPADEIVVVDNASTDATARVAKEAGTTVVVEPVRGIWPAAAAGYDAATGDLIARLDADSLPPTDWLAHIEAGFAARPELDAMTGPGHFYDCGPTRAALGETLYIGGYFWAMRLWLGNPPLFGSNFAMRASLWHEVRGSVHRTLREVHDDLDLSFHLDLGAVIVYEPTLLVGISSRPFDTWSGFARRLSWASRTMRLHWPDASPVHRRARRRATRSAA